jgi:two-component system LytT family response regulator
MNYSCIIVDDEKHQQERLINLLADEFREYTLLAACSSVNEGAKKIMELKPQLVFLDVVMPPQTGFDLLTELPERNFEVIFTTSYEEYAIKAFKVSAVDYLLKPFGVEELKEALKKFEQKISSQRSLNHVELLLENLRAGSIEKTKVALPTLSGFVFVPVADIIRCEADDNYTLFYFADKSTLLISKTLKDCEAHLSSYNFYRIHHSHLINMHFVKEYQKGKGGSVKMTDGSVLEVSIKKKDDFLKTFRRI